jgi:hypothetical protein
MQYSQKCKKIMSQQIIMERSAFQFEPHHLFSPSTILENNEVAIFGVNIMDMSKQWYV